MFVPGPLTRTSKAPTELQLAAGLRVFALWGREGSKFQWFLGVWESVRRVLACSLVWMTTVLVRWEFPGVDKFCRTQRIEDGLIESSRTCEFSDCLACLCSAFRHIKLHSSKMCFLIRRKMEQCPKQLQLHGGPAETCTCTVGAMIPPPPSMPPPPPPTPTMPPPPGRPVPRPLAASDVSAEARKLWSYPAYHELLVFATPCRSRQELQWAETALDEACPRMALESEIGACLSHAAVVPVVSCMCSRCCEAYDNDIFRSPLLSYFERYAVTHLESTT